MTDDKKIALVTGATRGIGQAIFKRLADAGYRVVGTATSESGVASIEAFMAAHSIDGGALVLNVCDSASIDALFTRIKSDFGRLSILVNNAAMTDDMILLRMKPDQWDRVIQTNLTGVYSVTKKALRDMFRAKWGRIVSVSSVVAAMGNVGQCNYAAAKAGLIGFSRSLAREMASFGVTVNCVCPGYIDTDMTKDLDQEQSDLMRSQIPMGRVGTVDEIADAVLFLLGNAYVTGEVLHVNGGLYMA